MAYATDEDPQASGALSSRAGSLARYTLVGGGGLLALQGMRRGGPVGAVMATLGCGVALVAGLTSPTVLAQASRAATKLAPGHPRTVRSAVTIDRPREEIYAFWRDFSNLSRLMPDVERVDIIDPTRSHWVVYGPGGARVEFDAIVEDDRPNERIAWRAAEDAEVQNAGVVEFREAPGGRGTEVSLSMEYQPPLGGAGRAVAWLTGQEPGRMAKDALRRLKQILETGEIPTVQGQPHGRRSLWKNAVE